jgi:hypothetical protein
MSSAQDRRQQPQRGSRSGALPPESQRKGRPPIRWQQTPIIAGDGTGRLTSPKPCVTLNPREGGTRLDANHGPKGPARKAVEGAVRLALSGLDGQWRARIVPIDAHCVEIESPDGFRCLAFIPNAEGQGRRAMARRLKEACRQATSGPTRWKRAWVLVMEEP